jgi:hypothetical protein
LYTMVVAIEQIGGGESCVVWRWWSCVYARGWAYMNLGFAYGQGCISMGWTQGLELKNKWFVMMVIQSLLVVVTEPKPRGGKESWSTAVLNIMIHWIEHLHAYEKLLWAVGQLHFIVGATLFRLSLSLSNVISTSKNPNPKPNFYILVRI